MIWRVPRVETPPALDARWRKTPWRRLPPLLLRRHMGPRPAHFPRVAAKLAYDRRALYVIFRVRDRYVRATARRRQDSVCQDSCVEFFFVPGRDLENGYFNLEVNAGGVLLFHFQRQPRHNPVPIGPPLLRRVAVAHSLPRRVEPEIRRAVTWTVEYRLPWAGLEAYRPVALPAPGTVWRANFYKCADATSHPHWLTWACVNRPQPDFHVPEDFGELRFA